MGDAIQSAIGYDLFRGEKDREGDGSALEEAMEALDMFAENSYYFLMFGFFFY